MNALTAGELLAVIGTCFLHCCQFFTMPTNYVMTQTLLKPESDIYKMQFPPLFMQGRGLGLVERAIFLKFDNRP